MKEVGAAAATLGAAMTAVSAYLAKTAIEADSTRKSFEYLAESHGQSADDILSALQKTSAGAVSANDLMLSANRAMTLGVADNTETFTQLMEIARDRAQVKGITTTQAFDNIVTGIGRGSPLILDYLGLIVDVVAANEDYAKQLGKTADQLTGTEQKQALLNAVLTQGQSTINKSAQTTLTASERMQAFKASIADTASTLGNFLVPIVTTATGWITSVVSKVREWAEENEGLAKVLTIAGSALGVLLTGVGVGILTFVKIVTTISSFVNIVKTLEITTKLATAAQWLWNVALSANPIGIVIIAITALIAAGIALWKNWDKVSKWLANAWDYIKLAFANAVKFIVNNILGPFIDYHAKIIGTITEWVGKLVGIFNKNLGNSIQEFSEKIKNSKKEIAGWADSLADSSRKSIAARNAIKEETDATEENTEAIENNVDVLDEAASVASDYIEQIEALAEAFQYAQTIGGKLDITLDDLTTYMLAHGYSVEQIDALYQEFGGDVNAVADSIKLDLRDVAREMNRTTDSMVDDVQDWTDEVKEAAQDATDARKDAIDDQLKAEEKAHKNASIYTG